MVTRGPQEKVSEAQEKVSEATSEAMDQTKQGLTEAYDKTSKAVNATYDQAMDYGREHPGQLTLIAFGSGIAIGLLLASVNSRSRLMPTVTNALTDIATELFRR